LERRPDSALIDAKPEWIREQASVVALLKARDSRSCYRLAFTRDATFAQNGGAQFR